MTAPLPPADDIEAAAREWVVHLSSGRATDADRAALEAWRAADPAHAAAYDKAAAVWGAFAEAEEMQAREEAAVAVAQAARPRRVRWGAPVAAGVSLAAATFAAFVFAPMLLDFTPAPLDAPVVTQTAEIREMTLEDGSVVTLGPKSVIDVAFTPAERHVVLAAGEAYFSVTKDPLRPFIVEAGETRVRVVGTKFDVRHGLDQIDVAVTEGIVEVTRPPFAPDGASEGRPDPGGGLTPEALAKEVVVLKAGERLAAAAPDAPAEVVPVGAREPGAWRLGRLDYASATLSEVIADANRYFESTIILSGDEVADLRVTASFRTDSIDAMLSSLELALPVEADRAMPGKIVLRLRNADAG